MSESKKSTDIKFEKPDDGSVEMVKVEIPGATKEDESRIVEVTKALADEQLSLKPEDRHPHWKGVKIVK